MNRTPILNLLASSNEPERLAAAEYAASHPQLCQAWAVELVLAAGDSSDSIAIAATEALEMLGPPTVHQLPRLADVIRTSEDGESVYWAVTLIGRLGPMAGPATAALIEALSRSPYLPVQERAAWALSRIGTAAADAAAALRWAAESGPPRLRRLATQALESVRGMAA